MTDNLNVSKLYQCNKAAEGIRNNSGQDMMPFCEEITVMKTEVKEERYDSEMSVDDMVFVNVKEEYISSPENNFENESLESIKTSEQSLEENLATENSYQKTDAAAKHNAESNKYKCDDCNYATHMKAYLMQHINIHSNERPFKCTYKNCKCLTGQEKSCECNMCGYAARRNRTLKIHVLRKHGNQMKNFKCKDCKYATHIKAYLEEHVRIHSNGRPFKCTYKNCKCAPEHEESCECKPCEYATTNKCNLKTHILAKHSTELKKYKCKICDYATHVKLSLVVHSRTHTGDKPFKCTYKICKCTPGQEQACVCDTCEYAAISNYSLKRHVVQMHNTGLKKYTCKNCEYVTHAKSSLLIHSRTHTGDKPFKCTYKNCKCEPGQEQTCECDMCDYAAITNDSLKRHVIRVHNTELKRYKCRNCKYVTDVKASLVIHSRTHTGDKPFKCTYKNCKCTPGEEQSPCECGVCEYATISNYNLQRHVIRYHSTELMEYKCKSCKYVTHAKSSLEIHSLIHSSL